MTNNCIAVIGGTGKSGTFIVNHLLSSGFRLKLLLRHPDRFCGDRHALALQQGDARCFTDVDALVRGCDMVVSALGQPAGEPSVFSAATANILSALNNNGVSRYIVTTGLSVDTPFDTKSDKVRQATEWMYRHYPETTKDKQAEYAMLASSNADWTMIRLPLIRQVPEHFPVSLSLEDCPGDSISAADLAHFIAGEIRECRYKRQAPFLYNL